MTLPEAERSALYSSSGVPEFYGINLMELLEFGVNQPYNVLLDQYLGANPIPYIDPTVPAGPAFDASVNDMIMVVDATKQFAWRAIQDDSETGSVFTLAPDDQWVTRSEKIGQYGAVQEGFMISSMRPCLGMII